MKYIIELPEEVKEKFDNATKDEIYGSYYDYNSVIGNAIKNGTPLSEELKTIKAETIIDELEKIKVEITECRKKHNCGVLECLDIIDKEIKGARRNRWRKGE